MVRRIMRQLIHHTALPIKPLVHTYIHTTTKFVNTRYKNIYTLLCNHIKFARNTYFNIENNSTKLTASTNMNNIARHRIKCCCHYLASISNDPNINRNNNRKLDYNNFSDDQHIILRAHQLKPKYAAVINQNNKNVPMPASMFLQHRLINIFTAFMKQCIPFLDYNHPNIKHNTALQHIVQQQQQSLQHILTPLVHNTIIDNDHDNQASKHKSHIIYDSIANIKAQQQLQHSILLMLIPDDIMLQLTSLAATYSQRYMSSNHLLPTLDEVLTVRNRIIKHGIICAPIDKNANSLSLQCPRRYKYQLRTTFIEDHHYIIHTGNKEDILTDFRQFYHKHKQYAKWYSTTNSKNKDKKQNSGNNGTYTRNHSCDANNYLPYSYILPKQKDLNRNRPIVSYSPHPLKHLYRLLSRCLTLLIKTLILHKHDKEANGNSDSNANTNTNLLTNTATHFTLWRTHDLKQQLQQFTQQCKQYRQQVNSRENNNSNAITSDIDIRYVYNTYDIKNMFTELKHDYIKDAITWLISTAMQQHYLQHRLQARRTLYHQPYLICEQQWPTYNTTAHKFVKVNVNDLFEIVEYDLAHIYFTTGMNVILQQTDGTPMRGYVSATYAIIACAAAEYKWLNSVGNELRTTLNHPIAIFARRFIDDLFLLFAYFTPSSNNNNSTKRATEEEDEKMQSEQQESMISTDYTQVLSLMQHLHDHCYHESLQLESTSNNNDRILTFLETNVNITPKHAHMDNATNTDNVNDNSSTINADIYLTPLQKNWEHLQAHGTQLLAKFTHWYSFTPDTVKIGVVKSSILRLYRNCNSNKPLLLLLAILKYDVEISSLHYPPYVLPQILKQCYHFTCDPIFLFIYHIYQQYVALAKRK